MREIWGRNQDDKKWKISIFLHTIICCGFVLESPHWVDSNTHPKHMILWRTYDNQGENTVCFFVKKKLYEYGDVHVMELQTACQWSVTTSWPCKILRFSSNHTLVKSSTISALGFTLRVAGGDVLSGTRISAAVEEAWSSGGVLTDDGCSELQLRNLP